MMELVEQLVAATGVSSAQAEGGGERVSLASRTLQGH